jgi:hypothetical protein
MTTRLLYCGIGLVYFLTGLLVEVPAAEQIYDCNFQKSKAKYPEWSNSEVTQFSRRMRFLGPLSNQSVQLTLKDLPPHQLIRLKFDLLVISSWDGSATTATAAGIRRGPDIFQLKVVNGPVLYRQTFCNVRTHEDMTNGDLQSHPELDLRLLTTARTGGKTIEIEELQDNDDETGTGSASYTLIPVFAHSEKELVLEFSAENLQDVDNESWGIDNVVVEVLQANEIEPLSADRLVQIGRTLQDKDSSMAAAASWELIARPAQAVKLAKELKPKLVVEDTDWQKLRTKVKQQIKQLEAPLFVDREQAFQALIDFGPEIQPILLNEAKLNRSVEVQERLRILNLRWASKAKQFSPQVLARIRMAKILETINTPESLTLAKEIGWE